MDGRCPPQYDYHCGRVCRQYLCTCDYEPGCTIDPQYQRICCQYELVHKPKTDPYAYTDQDAHEDTLTRYFGIQRSLRDPYDPVRFTGVNHIPRFLHADLSSLEMDYSNLLREREIMAASRYFGPGNYYKFRSIRPHNLTTTTSSDKKHEVPVPDEEDALRGIRKGKISSQALACGQMPYLN